MALVAGQIPISGYQTPDYSAATAAIACGPERENEKEEKARNNGGQGAAQIFMRGILQRLLVFGVLANGLELVKHA
jgi:hypothetical protein